MKKVTIFVTFQTVFISLTSAMPSRHVPVGAWLYTAAAHYKVSVQPGFPGKPEGDPCLSVAQE